MNQTAKIIFKDSGNGELNVKLEFNPALEKDTRSHAASAAIEALTWIRKKHENPAPPEQDNWTPVETNLPDSDITVCTYNEDSDTHKIGHYDDEVGYFLDDSATEIFVSHWQYVTTPV